MCDASNEQSCGTYPANVLAWYMDVHAPKTGDQVHRAAADKSAKAAFRDKRDGTHIKTVPSAVSFLLTKAL
jgi:hypothetical protein